MSIWVIEIEYDYGTWTEAGYFTSKEAAEAWIAEEHEADSERWSEAVASGEVELLDCQSVDDLLTKWRAVEIRPAEAAG